MRILINLAGYELVWFLCVAGGNLWAALALLLPVLHLLFSPCRRADAELMGALLLIGLVVDGMLVKAGFFEFKAAGVPIPFWLVVIWLALATLPNHSLYWMKGRLWLNVAFGGIGGPLAYWAGVKLGAASFTYSLIPSLLVLAVIWMMLWPAVMHLASLRLPGKLTTTGPASLS